eukprot:1175884-Prorocentrum_minimum.AAC.1
MLSRAATKVTTRALRSASSRSAFVFAFALFSSSPRLRCPHNIRSFVPLHLSTARSSSSLHRWFLFISPPLVPLHLRHWFLFISTSPSTCAATRRTAGGWYSCRYSRRRPPRLGPTAGSCPIAG